MEIECRALVGEVHTARRQVEGIAECCDGPSAGHRSHPSGTVGKQGIATDLALAIGCEEPGSGKPRSGLRCTFEELCPVESARVGGVPLHSRKMLRSILPRVVGCKGSGRRKAGRLGGRIDSGCISNRCRRRQTLRVRQGGNVRGRMNASFRRTDPRKRPKAGGMNNLLLLLRAALLTRNPKPIDEGPAALDAMHLGRRRRGVPQQPHTSQKKALALPRSCDYQRVRIPRYSRTRITTLPNAPR